MREVLFFYGALRRLPAACHIVAEHVRDDAQLLVYCTDQRRLERFDALLWSFEPDSFITHARCDDPLAAQAHVVLATSPADLDAIGACDRLLNLDLECPPGAARFAQILEVVSEHQADAQAARARWAQYQQEGHDVRGVPYDGSGKHAAAT